MAAEVFRIGGGVKLDPATVKAMAPAPPSSAMAPLEEGTFSYVAFDRNRDFTIGDGNSRMTYRSRARDKKTSIKWGQFKLLIEEIQFFTLYWDGDKVPEPIVVYVGSAAGTHIAVLANLFPSFAWHLYDPRDHDPILKTNPKITIHQQFFGDDDAKRYAERKDVFFIVDIRSSSYRRDEGLNIEEQKANEGLVAADMDRQASWTKIIRPIRASLKFRLPYTWPWMVALQGPTRTYLDGLVYLQQWGPQTTTETRLIPHPELGTRDWDYKAHEEMMFYHNTQVREKQKFLNPLTGQPTPISADQLGLMDDYDSAATTVIIMEYLRKFGADPSEDAVLKVMEALIAGTNKGATTLLGLRLGGKAITVTGDDDEE